MKRFIRTSVIIALLLAAGTMIFWYFFIRRTVPAHAKYIPSNAMAVATINSRAIALDQSSGGHLFPEFEKEPGLPGFLSTIMKAVKDNGGSGLHESDDVLAFAFRDGESAFGAFCLSVADSNMFGKLIRDELSKTLKETVIMAGQKKMIGIKGTQQVVLGWNGDAAMAVFAISDDDSSKIADACVKLLNTSPEKSILNNENFTTHEKTSFDLGLWVNVDEVLGFTGGGKLFRNMFYNMSYISLACDFNKGEIAARRTITYKEANTSPSPEPFLAGDAASTTGFVNFLLHFGKTKEEANSFDVYPLNDLPFEPEQCEALSACFDDHCTVLFNDTFSSKSEFITYTYDDDFNQIPTVTNKDITALGYTLCIPLKDAKTAQSILDETMKADSINAENGVYTIDMNGMNYRLFISDNVMYWTNWNRSDGKAGSTPADWSGMQLVVKPSTWLLADNSQMISFIFPDPQKARDILSAQLKKIVVTQTINSGTKGTDEFRIFFQNEEINTVIQLSEMGRKILK